MNWARRVVSRSSEERLRPDQPVAYGYYQGCIQRYAFASRFAVARDVLDIGCGSGYGASYIASKGARTVVGLDIDRKAIEYARSRYPQAFYVWADAMRLPFRDHSFDLAICFEVIEHVINFGALLSECTRVLTDRGILVCSTPNRESHYPLSRSVYHIYEFSLNELNDALSDHYNHVTLAGQHYIHADDLQSHKARTLGAGLAGALLSCVPHGSRIRQFLARSVMPESRRIVPRGTLEEPADPTYEVVPVDSRRGQIPTTLVAVAGCRRARQSART